jgi:hypothetical protein
MTAFSTDGSAGTVLTAQTNTSYGAKFSGTIRNNDPGYGWQYITIDLGGADLSAYDGFGLCIENVNENAWDFGVIAIDGSFSYDQADFFEIPIFVPTCFTVDFNLVDATDIHHVGFYVADDVPQGAQADDYVYEVRVAPLPEPGTLALFGFGLAGAAASYRRKRAAKKA